LAAQFENRSCTNAGCNILTSLEANARELRIELGRITDIRVTFAIQELRRFREERVDERA
jgi:hypothetical protein